MKLRTERVLDSLAAEEPCLGAAFLTYSFDPAFFEDHVLRAIYRLSSDPVEEARRYYDEALGALQLAPTVVIADADQRKPGRRLPYEVLEVSSRVFHPKVVLLLYEACARLQVGSGNISAGGYGGNTELFLSLDLPYADEESYPILSEIRGYLGRVGSLARQTPRELTRVLDELDRRVLPIGPDTAPCFQILDSTTAPILEQALSLIPVEATIRRVGFLAPFFEQDDSDALKDSASIFGALKQACGTDIALDVGVLWDNPSLRNTSSESTALEDWFDQLWAWSALYDDGSQNLEYITPRKLTAQLLKYDDAAGAPRTFNREAIEEAVEEGRLWPVPPPIAFAPQRTLEAAASYFKEVHLWLHPSSRLIDNRAVHRPLHAKLLLFSYEHEGQTSTLVVVGSANASRKALILPIEKTGNVELSVAFCIHGMHTLKTFVPELVWALPTALELEERSFPELPPNIALAIDEVVYDAASKELRIEWSLSRSLAPWELEYAGTRIAHSTEPATGSTIIESFELVPTTAELTLRSTQAEASVPILVVDLVALPARAALDLGLHELLLILGKRLGLERAQTLHQRHVATGEKGSLEELFGDSFDPTQVFRAWWVIADDLADRHASLRSMRLRLAGSIGVRTVWQKLKEASESGHLSEDEAWFYGAELLRTLQDIAFDQSATGIAKTSLLNEFRSDLKADLRALGTANSARPWAARVRSFYGL